jgi:hypothetical protein
VINYFSFLIKYKGPGKKLYNALVIAVAAARGGWSPKLVKVGKSNREGQE